MYNMNPPKTQRREESPNLEDLPDELLLHIFSNFEEPETLAFLCKVDHRLNRIVTPILYKEYTTLERDDSDDSGFEEAEINRRAGDTDCQFVRTLVEKPDLAKHVQTLDWYYNLARSQTRDSSLHKTAQKLQDEQLGLLFWGESMAERRERNGDFQESCDSLFLTTAMHATNIKHLRLSYDDDRRSRSNLILKARRSRLGPIRFLFPPIFQQLKSADVVLHMLRLDDLAWLMKIATLERLQVGRVREWHERTWDLGPKTSNISELTLEDCRLHWQNLAKIITTCKALTKLSYPGPESVRLVHDDDIPKLKEALDQHADTLENLHFDVIFQHVDEIGIEIINGPDEFGSFSHYQRLRELCIYSKLILCTEPAQLVRRIPLSLQTLRLTMCSRYSVGYNNVDFLEPVAKAISSVEGHLKTIYFSEDITGYMKCDAWQRNQQICASHGLNIRVWEMRHEQTDEWDEPERPWYDSSSNE